jgi:hypothetical protein
MSQSNKIEIIDKKCADYLREKGKIIQKGREISKKIEELQTEQNKLMLQAQKFADKATPIVNKACAGRLGEYEMIEGYDIKGEDKIIVKTYDVLEEFKKAFKEKKK